MKNLREFLKKYYPVIICLLVVVFVFRQFIFKGLLPIPSDIITGVYYPWLNQKWGTITGVPVKNPLPSDIPSLLYPWRMQVRSQIYSGNFPLWNDQIFSGMPLFANFQSSVLSISNLVFLFIKNTALAWSLGIFFQPIFMALAAYLFLRQIKFSKISSLVGALLYSFNGFSIVWMEYNVHGWVLFWLPLLLLSGELISKKNKWGNILLASSVGGSVLTGYPQLALYSFLTVLIYFLIKFFLKQINIRTILSMAVFSVLGLTLSAVLLLPGMESANLSIRNVDTVATSISTRFLPISYLTNLFAPDIHGNPATGNYSGTGYYDNFAMYLGVVAMVLSLIGLLSKNTKNQIRIFSLVLIIIGITLSTSNAVGLLIGDLNIFGIKSIAARAMILVIIGLILLAISGVESLLLKIKLLDLFISLGVASLLGGLFLFSSDSIYRHNLYLPIAVSLAIFGLLLIGKYFKKVFTILPVFILLLLIFEVTRFADKYLSFSPAKYLFPETPVISYLKNFTDINNSKYEFAEVIPENMWVPYGFRSAAGYDATAPISYSRLLGMVGNKNLSHPQGRVGKIDQINKISNLIGVNYLFILSTKEGKPDANGTIRSEITPPNFIKVSEEGPVKVFSIKDSSNTLNFYTRATPYTSEQEFIDLVNTSSFNPASQTLIKNGQLINSDNLGNLKIDSYNPGHVTVSTSSKVEGYVVFKQNRYPGWKVTIDGNKGELLEAEYSFMAVKVPSGAHVITFTYLPNTFIIGSIISSMSLLVLLGLIFKYVRK